MISVLSSTQSSHWVLVPLVSCIHESLPRAHRKETHNLSISMKKTTPLKVCTYTEQSPLINLLGGPWMSADKLCDDQRPPDSVWGKEGKRREPYFTHPKGFTRKINGVSNLEAKPDRPVCHIQQHSSTINARMEAILGLIYNYAIMTPHLDIKKLSLTCVLFEHFPKWWMDDSSPRGIHPFRTTEDSIWQWNDNLTNVSQGRLFVFCKLIYRTV